jgi:hypothetical protein
LKLVQFGAILKLVTRQLSAHPLGGSVNHGKIKQEYKMLFQVKIRVNIAKMTEFAQKLQNGELDRRLIRGETYCLKSDPAVGYSIWEAYSKDEFDTKFAPWRNYYSEVEVNQVITPLEAMASFFKL